MNVRRFCIVAAAIAAVGFLSGCSAGQTRPTPSPTPKRSTPTPTPSATPLPTGPFAVAVTNRDRSGSTYHVLLIDTSGHVVARTTAKLPLIKPNQTVDPALVSASNTTAYFRNGDNDIMSLSPGGVTALVKSIPAGSQAILAFAVSADDTRIAVALINEAPPNNSSDIQFAGSTGHGYVEDLTDANNHVNLWSNTDADAIRLPVGWHRNDLVDQVGFNQCQGYNGYGACGGGAVSYHVIDGATGSRVATVCEGPTNPPSGTYDSVNPQGAPTAAGIACNESQGSQTTSAGHTSIYAADWLGHEHSFMTASNSSAVGIQVGGCYLSPDGIRMACTAYQGGAVTLLTPNGKTHSLGRKYNILGWVDPTHLLVDVDVTSLAMLNADTGEISPIPRAQADKVAMVSTLPGSL